MRRFDWQRRRREWEVLDHPRFRNGIIWRHRETGHTIEYRGHNRTRRWCIVQDGEGLFVINPDTHSRLWEPDCDETAYYVTKHFIPEPEPEPEPEITMEEVQSWLNNTFVEARVVEIQEDEE